MIFAQMGGPGLPQYKKETTTVRTANGFAKGALLQLVHTFAANQDQQPTAITAETAVPALVDATPGLLAVAEEDVAAGGEGQVTTYGICRPNVTGAPTANALAHVGDSNGTVESGEATHKSFGVFLGTPVGGTAPMFLTQVNGIIA